MTQPLPLMANKKGLIMGVANNKSMAWGIAQAAFNHGAELAFTYQGEALEKRVRPLAAEVNSNIVLPCDVTDSDSIEEVVSEIEKKWGKLDFLVHAIAYSDKNELKGRYIDTSLSNFLNSMHISCFSFVEVVKKFSRIMTDGGSCLTLSYFGAERVIPHYNVMGVAKAALEASVRYMSHDLGQENIRVNAISAGPIKTLAASGIGDFRSILTWNELNSPLRRNITIEDVGGSAVALMSDLCSAITGEVIHVDSGYHTVGMIATDLAAQIADNLKDFQKSE
ncbi:MAG: enoyl-ACP reductase [Alphaproteobacteria bacterium]